MRVDDVYDAVCHACASRKSRLWRQRMPLACDPSIAHFLKHPTAACSRSVIHAGQKCSQFCGIGRSGILNELCLELGPQKNFWETELGNEVVETRLCRATLSCSDHWPGGKHRRVVQEQEKLSPRLHGCCAIGRSVTLIHSLPLIFRPCVSAMMPAKKYLGKITRLISSSDSLKQRANHADFERYGLGTGNKTNQPPRHVVAQRCAIPSRPLVAASAATASSSTAASPAWSQSSCCPRHQLPSFFKSCSSFAEMTTSHAT